MSKKAATDSPVEDDAKAAAEDIAAIERTLAGEMSAFDELIERYQRRAVAVAYRLLGNIDDAQEVCQESFLRAYRSLSGLQERGRFGPWLMRIVSNQSLNFRRGRRPMLSLHGDDDDSGDSQAASIKYRGEEGDSLEASELQGAIAAAIESLPDPQRLALVLFAIEEMPQKDVAEILECSVEMVKWNVFQARKTLKEKLKGLLEE
jgi:RNA polymerase sigma-70 factor, ECF subfamily